MNDQYVTKKRNFMIKKFNSIQQNESIVRKKNDGEKIKVYSKIEGGYYSK